jgi:hypothetical protein
MAITKGLDGALQYEPRSLRIRGFVKGVGVYLNALREGAAAAHEYETLTRQGRTHEEAVAQVFEEHFDRR